MQAWRAYIAFQWHHYFRTHRYLREIAAVVIFGIFFGGFLSDAHGGAGVWILFSVFAIILSSMTAPSLFLLERGTTLYFLIGKPHGRRRYFLSKIALIVLIDLGILLAFALVYGLRFPSFSYFLLLPVRLALVALILLQVTGLIALTMAYRPTWTWWIFVWIVFGGIVNKGGVLPIHGIAEGYKLLVFLLPPFQELTFLSTSLEFDLLGWIWLGLALVQTGLFLGWGLRGFYRKDIVQ